MADDAYLCKYYVRYQETYQNYVLLFTDLYYLLAYIQCVSSVFNLPA